MQTLDQMTVVLIIASSFYVRLSYCFYDARGGGYSIWLQRTWVSTAVLLIVLYFVLLEKTVCLLSNSL